MSVQVENLEKNTAKLTITVSADEFEKALQRAYLREKNRITVQGFRKGKAPRKIIEKVYGPQIFYEDAANYIIPTAYDDAVKESGVEVVSRPEVDVTQIEEGKDFIFTAQVAVRPAVTLGAYKNLEVEEEPVTVTDEEIENQLKEEQKKQVVMQDVDDRPAQNGDIVNIDYEGFCDGKAFDGGKGENYDLTLGSGSFIPGFEDQLVGKNTGDKVDVEVTFPKDYHAENLAGKPATFKVTVNAIKKEILPEIDDEFASEVSDFDTLEEYKADLRKKTLDRKTKEAENRKKSDAVDKAVANAQMEVPDAMVDTQARDMVNNFARRIQQQGMSIDQYLKYTGMTVDQLVEQTKPQALTNIQSRLVLEEVVKAENIQVSDEEVDEEIKKMADSYKMEADKVKESLGEENLKALREDLAVQKAADLIGDSAVVVAPKAEEKADAPAEEKAAESADKPADEQ